MAAALDAAIIAAAAELNEKDMTADQIGSYIDAFVSANMDAGNPVAEKYKLTNINVDYATQQVSARISADVPMTLLGVIGWKVMPVSLVSPRNSAARSQRSCHDLRRDRLDGRQQAHQPEKGGKEGIGILLDVNTPTRERLRISMIPYAEAVNAGPFKPFVFAEPTGFTESIRLMATPIRRCRRLHDRAQGNRAIFRRGAGQVRGQPRPAAHELSGHRGAAADCGQGTAFLCGRQARRRRHHGGQIGIQWAWYTISPQWPPSCRRPTSRSPTASNCANTRSS